MLVWGRVTLADFVREDFKILKFASDEEDRDRFQRGGPRVVLNGPMST